jgi:oligoribonuclease NrnB/cAMP/cGMP phosphodiesterase (DHH superfamily)
MTLADIVYNWLTDNSELDENQVTDILEEQEDIVIALEIWDQTGISEYTIDDIEEQVSAFRKYRPDIQNDTKYYSY